MQCAAFLPAMTANDAMRVVHIHIAAELVPGPCTTSAAMLGMGVVGAYAARHTRGHSFQMNKFV